MDTLFCKKKVNKALDPIGPYLLFVETWFVYTYITTDYEIRLVKKILHWVMVPSLASFCVTI